MGHEKIFPGLGRYHLSREDRATIDADFGLVCLDANLVAREKGDIGRSGGTELAVPGIYFWTVVIASATYNIYIGKTSSLKRRMNDYAKEFQPHSPNDFKLRIFQQAIFEHAPDAVFQLRFRPASLGDCTRLETETVRNFLPLLNERSVPSAETREAFRNAFEEFYRSGFEELLGFSGT